MPPGMLVCCPPRHPALRCHKPRRTISRSRACGKDASTGPGQGGTLATPRLHASTTNRAGCRGFFFFFLRVRIPSAGTAAASTAAAACRLNTGKGQSTRARAGGEHVGTCTSRGIHHRCAHGRLHGGCAAFKAVGRAWRKSPRNGHRHTVQYVSVRCGCCRRSMLHPWSPQELGGSVCVRVSAPPTEPAPTDGPLPTHLSTLLPAKEDLHVLAHWREVAERLDQQRECGLRLAIGRGIFVALLTGRNTDASCGDAHRPYPFAPAHPQHNITPLTAGGCPLTSK